MEQEWRRVTVPDGGRVLPAEALTEGYRDDVHALDGWGAGWVCLLSIQVCKN